MQIFPIRNYSQVIFQPVVCSALPSEFVLLEEENYNALYEICSYKI